MSPIYKPNEVVSANAAYLFIRPNYKGHSDASRIDALFKRLEVRPDMTDERGKPLYRVKNLVPARRAIALEERESKRKAKEKQAHKRQRKPAPTGVDIASLIKRIERLENLISNPEKFSLCG